MRFEWSRKQSKKKDFFGFNKFGTRTQLTTINNPTWGDGVRTFMKKYAQGLDKIFTEDSDYKNALKVTVFAEYFGPNSFAGWHDPNDKKDVVLFDVDVYQKGLVKPAIFIEKFGHLGIPDVVYEGYYTQQFIDDVRNNIYNLNEGVVVKGLIKVKRKDVENVWMVKIKTNQWLERVKALLGENKLLEELNGDKSLLV